MGWKKKKNVTAGGRGVAILNCAATICYIRQSKESGGGKRSSLFCSAVLSSGLLSSALLCFALLCPAFPAVLAGISVCGAYQHQLGLGGPESTPTNEPTRRAHNNSINSDTRKKNEKKRCCCMFRVFLSHLYHGKQESVHLRHPIWQESVQDLSGCLGSDSPSAAGPGAIPVPVGCSLFKVW